MGRRLASVGARGAAIALWVAIALALGCASTPDDSAGLTHILQPGENLYRLSQFYGVSVDDIVKANDIDDVTELEVGQRIWIPDTKRGAAEKSLAGSGSGSAGRPPWP